MRNKNLDSANFCIQLDEITNSATSEFIDRITTVIASPNFLEKFTTDLILPKDLNSLILLNILVWYLPEGIRELLRVQLEEIKTSQDNFILKFFQKSKTEMIVFLQETSLWHTRDFFGNLYNTKKIQRVLKLVRFRKRNKLVRKPQRKRGYNDKGSQRLEHERRSIGPQTRLQNLLETERLILQDTIHLIEGFLHGG